MNVFDLEGSLSLDTKEFEKAIKNAKKQGEELGKGLQEQDKQFIELQKELGRLANELSAAQDEINSLKTQLNGSAKAADSNADSTADMADKMKKAKDAMDKAADSAEDLGDEEEKTSDKTDDYSDSAEEAKEKSHRFEKALSSLGSMASDVDGKIGGLAVAIKDTLVKAAEVGAAAIGAASTAVAALTKSAVTSYGEYEQLVGGVDTLFGASSKKVQKYADDAYKTAGMSANQYMETVTSFSASLLQGLGGDTAKAADIADMAIRDMSDNANKMGTDMSAIQNAYQGFAKQNYTMLDNLKLGYGGTKGEMARLLNYANQLDSSILGEGVTVDEKFNDVSFDSMIRAIHIVQNEMGITGTTASEAAGTLQGSAGSMKAAWENLITELGKDNGDISGKFENLAEAAAISFDNIIPRINVVLDNIGVLIDKAVPVITSHLPDVTRKILPKLLTSGFNLTATVFTTIARQAPAIIDYLRPELPKLWDKLQTLGSLLMNNVIIPAWDFVTVQLPQYINSTISKIDFKAVGETISSAITTGLIGIANFVSEIDWVQVGQSIADFINGIDFAGIARALAGLFGAALKALPDLLTGILSEIDFTNFMDGLALIFVPLMLGQFKDKLTTSNAWEDIRNVINEKFGGSDGLGAGAGSKFLAALEAFWVGWEIGSAIYNHFEEEINGVLFPIFEKIKDAWNRIFEIDLDVQQNGDSFIVSRTSKPISSFSNSYESSTYNELARKWGAYDDDYFEKWYGMTKEEYLRAAAKAKTEQRNATASKLQGIGQAGLFGLNSFSAHATGGLMINNPVLTTSGDLFGEAGREVILPLDRNTGWMDELAKRLGGSSGVVVQNLNINMDGMKIASDYDTERFVEVLSERLQALSTSQARQVGGVGW